jgi:hypothetical protein
MVNRHLQRPNPRDKKTKRRALWYDRRKTRDCREASEDGALAEVVVDIIKIINDILSMGRKIRPRYRANLLLFGNQ